MQVVDKVSSFRLHVDKRTKLGAKEVWFPPARNPHVRVERSPGLPLALLR